MQSIRHGHTTCYIQGVHERIDTLYSNPPSMSMGHWRRFSPRCPGSTPFSKNSPVLFQSNNSFPFISFILCPFRSELLFLLLFSAYLVVGFSTSLYTCSRHNHRGSVFFFFLFPFFFLFFPRLLSYFLFSFLFPFFLGSSCICPSSPSPA
jgi:hypothetical protein